MSSTNRGSDRHKHISDYYVTPVPEIVLFLDAFMDKYPEIDLFTSKILDPVAGGDRTHPMSYPEALKIKGVEDVITVDIRDDSRAGIKADFLKYNFFEQFDMVISNPPFNVALDIIEKALEVVRDDGYVIMLLRLNFFGSQSRFPFWKNNMPESCFVHHKRMSFTNGGTDSIEYMHAVWHKGHRTDNTKLYII